MTPQQRAAVDDILTLVEDDEIVDSPGPIHVFEGDAGDDDVLVLYDSDTRIISIDAAGNLSSGFVVPTPPAMTPGWDGGWEPDVATPGQAEREAVDINHLPVTPAAAALYKLCSAWTSDAFRIPRMLGEKDPRAIALQDCAIALRDAVNGLRRDGEL